MQDHLSENSGFVSGTYKTQFRGKDTEYRSFVPSPVNKPYDVQDERIFSFLEEAVSHLTRLDAYSHLVPDFRLFIKMHAKTEAVKSSKIEGTNTNIDDAVLEEKEVVPERRDDWEEVQNYVKAMDYGIDRLSDLPICMRLLCEVHKILMQGVRGEEKQPGEIRKSQNWIGGSIKSASFVPPHPDDLSESLKDLEYFWNNKNLHIPNLLKIAISHYQFETIHPFNDGNGRLGRILIVLQLKQFGILQQPVLYLSDFFERNKGDYYDSLILVRKQNNMDQWLLFFLEGIIETAKKGEEMFQKIIDLKKGYDEKIVTFGRQAETANNLLRFSYSTPAFDIATAAKNINMSTTATANTINRLVSEGILKEITGYSRNRIFTLHQYIDIFRT